MSATGTAKTSGSPPFRCGDVGTAAAIDARDDCRRGCHHCELAIADTLIGQTRLRDA